MLTPLPVNPLATSLLAGTQQAKALLPQKAASQLTRRPAIPSNGSGKGRNLDPREDRHEQQAKNYVSKFDVSI